MKAAVEVYRGIEFVRLSSLSPEEKRGLLEAKYFTKTIKILRDQELINDCLPYHFYLEWYETSSGIHSGVARELASLVKLKSSLPVNPTIEETATASPVDAKR